MIDSLIAYREGKRYGVDTTMNGSMYDVSDQDIRALAHFARRHALTPAQITPLSSRRAISASGSPSRRP